jgi:hypothetical protein
MWFVEETQAKTTVPTANGATEGHGASPGHLQKLVDEGNQVLWLTKPKTRCR